MQAFDGILCVAETAQNATHARRGKIPSTPNLPHSASRAGERSCKRSMVFYAWSKRLKRPRMRHKPDFQSAFLSVYVLWCCSIVTKNAASLLPKMLHS